MFLLATMQIMFFTVELALEEQPACGLRARIRAPLFILRFYVLNQRQIAAGSRSPSMRRNATGKNSRTDKRELISRARGSQERTACGNGDGAGIASRRVSRKRDRGRPNEIRIDNIAIRRDKFVSPALFPREISRRNLKPVSGTRTDRRPGRVNRTAGGVGGGEEREGEKESRVESRDKLRRSQFLDAGRRRRYKTGRRRPTAF